MNNLFLVIRTNKYTGNFDRELMAYVFGIVPDEDDDVVEEEFGCFSEETDDDIDFTDELSLNYDRCRFGRCDSEYYGYDIDTHPEGGKECNSIYVAIKNKFSDTCFQKLEQRLNKFARRVAGLKILSVDYYKNIFVKD